MFHKDFKIIFPGMKHAIIVPKLDDSFHLAVVQSSIVDIQLLWNSNSVPWQHVLVGVQADMLTSKMFSYHAYSRQNKIYYRKLCNVALYCGCLE